MRTFKLWAGGDAHVGTDMARANRRSLADVILQAEQGGAEGGPPFEWDIMLDIGDLSGSQTPPDDEEGQEVVRQYSASTKHPREDFYNIVGNHDASGPDEPCQWWFRKWVDTIGEHSKYSGVHADRRPYPVEGTWERYLFQVGNVLFLAMGDLRQCGGHFEISRQQEYFNEPVVDVFGRDGGGQYQVLPPHERLCTSGVVRQGGKDGAAADAVLIPKISEQTPAK